MKLVVVSILAGEQIHVSGVSCGESDQSIVRYFIIQVRISRIQLKFCIELDYLRPQIQFFASEKLSVQLQALKFMMSAVN